MTMTVYVTDRQGVEHSVVHTDSIEELDGALYCKNRDGKTIAGFRSYSHFTTTVEDEPKADPDEDLAGKVNIKIDVPGWEGAGDLIRKTVEDMMRELRSGNVRNRR